MKLKLSDAAEQEGGAAADWYNDQRNGLGAEFLNALESLLASIEFAPESFSRLEDYSGARHFRQGLLKRFPYKVIFQILPDGILVGIAVAHTSRHPDYWRKRMV